MTVRILTGDCRALLKTLPDASVHTCVTSPPYYGLRDYGTAQWEGGHAGCEHIAPQGGPSEKQERSAGTRQIQYRSVCRCGARRIDAQMGLEATPEEWIAGMVAVFREVRRILRPDGTLWLNVSGCYASGGKRPNQSPSPERVLACDNGGTELPSSQAPGCAYPGRDDECLSGSPNHHGHIAGIDQQTSPAPLLDAMKDHDSEHQAWTSAAPSQPDVPASTSLSLSLNAQDAFCLASVDAGDVSTPRLPLATLPSAHMAQSIGDKALTRGPLADRTSDKAPSSRACDCGSCGICFARLAMSCLRFKAKDYMDMGHLLVLALQADGWYYRSPIVWAKPNPMPESVTDRPTSAYEHVFLLSHSPRYYYDAEAIREEAEYGRRDASGSWRGAAYLNQNGAQDNGTSSGISGSITGRHPETGRNARNVWTIATEAFPEAHFATFPTELAERCIKAGTSERGCCAKCGVPWVRQTERKSQVQHAQPQHPSVTGHTRNAFGGEAEWNSYIAPVTTGWAASCKCDAPTQPCTVLDPFMGSGTTCLVADRLQRHAIGIELNPAYAAMARNRITQDAGLFAEVAD